MKRLVLFDIDGTLVLTGRAGVRALNRAFADLLGIENALGAMKLAGRTDRAIVNDVVARHGRGRALDGEALTAFCARYYACLREEIDVDGPGKRMLPGVRPLLQTLVRQPDVGVALLTGNFEQGARIKLEHFGLWEFFGWGAFGGEVTDRNALLQIALTGARQRGLPDLPPSSIFVVGDTPQDVACARSGGAKSVAVATGPYSADALLASGADVVFEDLSDTSRFLEVLDGR